MKIMKILTFLKRINKNNVNPIILCDNNANLENPAIQFDNYETHENIRNSMR